MKYYKLIPIKPEIKPELFGYFSKEYLYSIIEGGEKEYNKELFAERCIDYFEGEKVYRCKDWNFMRKHFTVEELPKFETRFEALWLLNK